MDVSDDENYASSSNSKRAKIDKSKKKVKVLKLKVMKAFSKAQKTVAKS
jgi:hypothetical protein